MVVGLVLVIVGAVLANTNAYNKVNGFQRVTLSDGTGTVTFTKAGGYVAYYESASVTNSTNQKVPEISGTAHEPGHRAAVGPDHPVRQPFGRQDQIPAL